jgi:acetyltransferase
MPEMPDALLKAITDVDDRGRLALVAESESAGGRALVAISECIAIDESTAEVGLVVRDDWQRQGVGTVLANLTLLAGEGRGCRRFMAQVLYENAGILRLLGKVGDVVSRTSSSDAFEVTFVRKSANALTASGDCSNGRSAR